MNALYVGFEVFGFYFLKIWHTCFGGSFKIQSFFCSVLYSHSSFSDIFSEYERNTVRLHVLFKACCSSYMRTSY